MIRIFEYIPTQDLYVLDQDEVSGEILGARKLQEERYDSYILEIPWESDPEILKFVKENRVNFFDYATRRLLR
jgi:hypothetical protein